MTKYTYGSHGEVTRVVRNCTSSGTTPPADASTCTAAGTQDAATNVRTDALYDTVGLLVLEWDELGRATKHVYDAAGNETATVRNYTCTGTTAPARGSACGSEVDRTFNAATNVTTTRGFPAGTTATKLGLPTSETDPVGNVTTFAHDALGRQTGETLPGDASIPALTRTTTYDELGNVTSESETWSGGSRLTTHAFDRLNRPISTTVEAGATDIVTTSTFDAAGNTVQTTADGVSTGRTFDALGRLLTETVGGAVTNHEYRADGAETSVESPEGEVIARAYDLARRLVSETVDPGGADLLTAYAYDRLGRELEVTGPIDLTTSTYDRLGHKLTSTVNGETTISTYDAAGNTITVTDPAGIVQTTGYDSLDRPTVVIDNDVANPTLPSEDVTTTTWYDAAGRTLAVRDPAGITTRTIPSVRGLAATTIANCTDTGTTPTTNPPACTGGGTHDGRTNVVTTSTYDGTGATLLTVVAAGTGAEAQSETAYDAAGRLQATKDPRGTITRTLYDAAGRPWKTVTNCTEDTSNPAPPSGSWWECAGSTLNDGTWNLVSTRTYDAAGNVAAETAPNGRVTTYVHDDDGRLVNRIDNDVASPTLPSEDVTTTYYYDEAGRQTAVRAPTETGTTFAVTRYLFDTDGRLASEIRNCTISGTTPPADPAACTGAGTRDAATNLVTEYAYDAQGNRTKVTAPDPAATTGTSTATTVTRYAFDDAGRLCRVVAGSTQSDAAWDALADPCTAAISGTATTNVSTRYTYDGAGNLATMVDANGSTTTYGYDAAGRETSVTDPLGRTVTTAYDALGRRASQTDRRGETTTWTYDGAGRVTARTTDDGTTSYSYDDNGNRLTAAAGTVTVTTQYDRLDRPVSVTISNDASATTTYAYGLAAVTRTDPTGTSTATLDPFGRQVALDDPVTTGTWAFAYRADGQPASVTPPNGWGNVTSSSYDAAGSPTGLATTNAAFTYTLNRAGHRLTETATVAGDPQNGTATFTFDPLGRLTGYSLPSIRTLGATWQADPNRTALTTDGTPVSTTFDAADRPTSTGFSTDLDGRLTAVPARGGAPATSLAYDALGRLDIGHGGGRHPHLRLRPARSPRHGQRGWQPGRQLPLRGADELGRPAPRRRQGGDKEHRHRLERHPARRLGGRRLGLASSPHQRPR